MKASNEWRITAVVAAALVAMTALPASPVQAEDASKAEHFPREWFWGTDAQHAKHQAMVGKPMPLLKLSGWIGQEYKPADLKGKIVVIDFWATWCGPCIAAIPKNNAIQEKYGDKGVVIIGVCGSRGQEKMPEVAEQRGVKYSLARDAEQESAPAWNVMWWPTYAVIDRNGIVRGVGLKTSSVEAAVKQVLQEQPAKGEAVAAKPAAAPSDDPAPAEKAADASGVKEEWLEGNAAQRARLEGLHGAATPPALSVDAGTWLNSEPMTLADLKGKVVVLDFWATWCGPCIAAVPHTNELMAKYGDQGLVIIGVCHQRGAEKMKETAEKHKIAYPLVADTEGKTVQAYRVNGFPDYYIIDRAGTLRIADCKNGSVEDAIKLLLAEPAPQQAAAK